MNGLDFACPNCRRYIDAGYRWAYWQLEEPGIVERCEGVDVTAILAHGAYWDPPEDERNEWLCGRVLPSVRQFLADHRGHGIVYLDAEDIWAEESLVYNWSEVGGL